MSAATLAGVDGTNPLGFLAALGTLVAARAAGASDARLGWKRSRTWVPVLDGLSSSDPEGLSEIVAGALRGREVSLEADRARVDAEKAHKAARTAVKRKRDQLKKEGLRGDERRAAEQAQLVPVEEECKRLRSEWLKALRAAVPRPELCLGARVDCTGQEYREHAGVFLGEADRTRSEPLDLLAAFASDANLERDGQVEPTPFCFIRGGGHQDFLDTARKLIAEVSAERVRRTLFEPWIYRDPKLSMRWDPIEDKRYALTDTKPADEVPRTVWMANLLGYRALAIFPCAPARGGLGTTAWEERTFSWPIWESPAPPDTIRSLLQLRELHEQHPERSVLRARGVVAVFRTRKIRFPPTGRSYKWNFTPSREA